MKYLVFLLCSILFAYSSRWGPLYVSLFAENPSKILGSLYRHAEPCPDAAIAGVECKVMYRIRQADIPKTTNIDALGLGIIVHATQIGCADQFVPKVRYGTPETAGKILDYLNIYQTVSLADLNCSSDILVKAWAPKSFRRYGFIDSQAVVGNHVTIERIKKFVEFFRTPFLAMLTALFLGLFLLNRLIKGITQIEATRSPAEQYSSEWLAFMFIISGLANTLFPVLSDSYVFARLSNFFVIVGLSGAAVGAIQNLNMLSPLYALARKFSNILPASLMPLRSIKPWLYFIACVYVCSPYYAVAYAPTLCGFGILLASAGYITRQYYFACYGLAILSDGMKLFMLHSLPTSHVFMAYLLLCQSDLFLERMRKSTNLVSSLRWARNRVTALSQGLTPQQLLQDLAERYSINQITLISNKTEGGCDINIQTKIDGNWSNQQFYRDCLPPIFSHTVTTRENLWHIEQDSLLALNLRKGEKTEREYSGQYFSVLPLLRDSKPVGAIGFTNYSADLCHEEFRRFELQSVLELILPVLGSKISYQDASEREGWGTLCATVVRDINEYKPRILTTPNWPNEIAEIIAKNIGIRVYIGRLDHSTRRVHVEGLSGYSEQTSEKYRGATFYAVSHNEQGPMPLAINRKKIMTVDNIDLIRNILHPATLDLFRESHTKSCAAIPIFESINTHSEPNNLFESTQAQIWGVLWLESENQSKFLPQHEAGLQSIATSIESLLSHLNIVGMTNKATQALAGFIPTTILDKILKGLPVRQNESGYLIMADLRDSTRLSRIIGAENWNSFIKALAPKIEHLGQKYGYTLQMIVWDAFYLTKANTPSSTELDQLVSLSRELTLQINTTVESQFATHILDDRYERARFCITYGDITRDIKGSLTNSWAIVGQAMAEVSKLEQKCKSVSGWLFASENCFSYGANQCWQAIDSTQNSGPSIYRYKDAAAQLDAADDDQAETKRAA